MLRVRTARVCLRTVYAVKKQNNLKMTWNITVYNMSTVPNDEKITSSGKMPVEDQQNKFANLSEHEQKMLKLFQMERETLWVLGYLAPEHVTDEQWLYILNHCHSIDSRRAYFKSLERYSIKKQKMKEKREAEKNLKEREDTKKVKKENRMMLMTTQSTLDDYIKYRMISLFLNGPRIVVDCAFEDEMNIKEISSLSRQVVLMHAVNKAHSDPVHLHFCNISSSSNLYEKISSLLKLYSVSENSYLKFYPKEKLVYLSPDAKKYMTNFNDDDVYIIGGLVDRGASKRYTFAKAKEQNIRTLKLPIDKFQRWGGGSKRLALNHVLGILLDVRSTGNWLTALKHVPKRKIAQ